MRRDQRQTGSARTAKPTKMELIWATRKPAPAGPFPWDPSMPDTRKPSKREQRRSYEFNRPTA